MGVVLAGAVFGASLVQVFWAVAIDARLTATVLAGGDSAIFLAVEGLEETGAAVHADETRFELLGVPGYDGVRALLLFTMNHGAYLNDVPCHASCEIWSISSFEVQNMHSIWSGLFSST